MTTNTSVTSTPTNRDSVTRVIATVEHLYECVTGRPVPPVTSGTYAPIPPEVDAGRHVEERLDELASLLDSDPARGQVTWVPPISIRETDHEWVLEVELGGVDRSRLRTEVLGNMLVITGERAHPPSSELRFSERPYGRFARAVVMPRGVATNRISAKLEHGLLHIRAERARAGEQARTLPVT